MVRLRAVCDGRMSSAELLSLRCNVLPASLFIQRSVLPVLVRHSSVGTESEPKAAQRSDESGRKNKGGSDARASIDRELDTRLYVVEEVGEWAMSKSGERRGEE